MKRKKRIEELGGIGAVGVNYFTYNITLRTLCMCILRQLAASDMFPPSHQVFCFAK